jgi:hexosaminidase
LFAPDFAISYFFFFFQLESVMSATQFTLVPLPRHIETRGTALSLPADGQIYIGNPRLLFEAQTLQQHLRAKAGRDYPIVAWRGDGFAIELLLDPELAGSQRYTLDISEPSINIVGADHAAVWYGVATLQQLITQFGASLPTLHIDDHPDFAQRGFSIDISRDKVPTMETLYRLIDIFADLKLNQLQLYIEHTFAFQAHEDVWRDASPVTGQEILEIDAYCRQRHITLVPNQNSLGHMERLLKHPRYAPLAESPDGFYAPWDQQYPPTSLNPLDPGSLALVLSLYDELLPHYTADTLNVGGDEPWELGQGRSKPEADRIGVGRLYLDFLLKLYAGVSKHGKKMMFWDDFIVHHPELIPELPPNVTGMIWGYEWDHPFEERSQLFQRSNIPFYVCAGTSSWNTFGGRLDNMIANQRNAVSNGLKYGGAGHLNTEWGDYGHWQTLPINYPGIAYGAALAWAQAANWELDLAPALSLHVLDDSSGILADVLLRLARIYLHPGLGRHNGDALVDLMRVGEGTGLDKWKAAFAERGGSAASFAAALDDVAAIRATLGGATFTTEELQRIQRELTLSADFIHHASQRGLAVHGAGRVSLQDLRDDLQNLVSRYRAVWLERNRVGGLDDSTARFEPALGAYEAVGV